MEDKPLSGKTRRRISDGELSVRVFEVLDQLGYSQSMVEHRREAWREANGIVNSTGQNPTILIAGSKAEGFTAPSESDTDRVFLDNYTMCRIPEDDSPTLSNTKCEFTMDKEHCHPGHFRLEQKEAATYECLNIKQALFVHDNGRTFVSSEKYRTSNMQDKTKETISGPALTGCNEYYSWDFVYAFPCTSQQQLLAEWINRPRHHNWPTPDLIAEVPKLEAQMVPVGCKSSEHKDIEWRVCFIPSEQRLTNSWEENQYKIYILLKLIKKSQLKPISEEISSYVLKNIMLWYTEQNPRHIFQKEHLLQNVILCLKNLKEAINTNHLPYYMIPGRNLLTGKISLELKQQLIEKVKELIQEGPNVILRLPKVQAALKMSQAELAERGRWRDDLEKLALERWNIWLTHWRPGMEREELPFPNKIDELAWQDPDYIRVDEKMNDMVWPKWRDYHGDDRRDILRRKVADPLS